MWKIMDQVHQWIKHRYSVGLVTLVDSDGSTYRRPGAKMAVREDGKMVGSISGGCLESDVSHHVEEVIRNNEDKIIHYDLNDDVVLGLGLGCGGSISLLIEGNPQPWLNQVFLANEEYIIVKVIDTHHPFFKVGTAGVFRKDTFIWKKEKNDVLLGWLQEHCVNALYQRSNQHVNIEWEGYSIRLFLEFIAPPHTIVIFGGGDDAVPVAKMGMQLDFDVVVADHRPEHMLESRFLGCQIVRWSGEQKTNLSQYCLNTASVIMSHHVQRDAEALEYFLSTDTYYIGLLGPRKRLKKLESHFKNVNLSQIEKDERVYSPIGLDIGSDTPEEVAVSILSEIIAVRNNCNGGYLRRKNGSIH